MNSSNPEKFCPTCKTLLKILNSSPDKIQTGGSKYADIINSILSNEWDESLINNVSNIKDILKSSEYKMLSLENQESIFNKIQELLPKNKKELFEKKIINK